MLLALWIIGQQVILYLAGLQDVPQAFTMRRWAGASFFSRLRHVTIPMLTPAIFFHVITSVISPSVFRHSFHHDGTGFPANSTLFYSIYMYKQAFQYFQMGYASALAWLLFLTTLVDACHFGRHGSGPMPAEQN